MFSFVFASVQKKKTLDYKLVCMYNLTMNLFRLIHSQFIEIKHLSVLVLPFIQIDILRSQQSIRPRL